MFLTPYENKGLLCWQFWKQRVDKQLVKQDCNKFEAFMKCTKQQCCQLLIIQKFLEIVVIMRPDSLELTTGFEYLRKPFCALPVLDSALAIAFELFGCHVPIQGMVPQLRFSFLALVDKAIHASSCVLSS